MEQTAQKIGKGCYTCKHRDTDSHEEPCCTCLNDFTLTIEDDSPCWESRGTSTKGATHVYPRDEAQGGMMDATEVRREFVECVLPGIMATYGPDDTPAIEQGFNDWTDGLCKDGRITSAQYNNLAHPKLTYSELMLAAMASRCER